jgi:hypothetical protein
MKNIEKSLKRDKKELRGLKEAIKEKQKAINSGQPIKK